MLHIPDIVIFLLLQRVTSQRRPRRHTLSCTLQLTGQYGRIAGLCQETQEDSCLACATTFRGGSFLAEWETLLFNASSPKGRKSCGDARPTKSADGPPRRASVPARLAKPFRPTKISRTLSRRLGVLRLGKAGLAHHAHSIKYTVAGYGLVRRPRLCRCAKDSTFGSRIPRLAPAEISLGQSR